MKNEKKDYDIKCPKNNLFLYGYKHYFDFFTNLYQKRKLPNAILLSGPKGLGKSTFVYHFVNYIFSFNDTNKYSLENFSINENNSNYKFINNNTHPNFFLIENNNTEKYIAIDQIRELLKFLSKSTYSNNTKFVMIDNAEFLNLSSSNALLKSLEEPGHNTFFFIINDSSYKIINTIKSRCCEFNISFNSSEKEKIFQNLLKDYNLNFEETDLNNYFLETPGYLLNYNLILSNSKKANSNFLDKIFYFIDYYIEDKSNANLAIIKTLIQKFYKDLFLNYNEKLIYFHNLKKILNEISNMKKFNLNEKSSFIWIKETLINDSK